MVSSEKNISYVKINFETNIQGITMLNRRSEIMRSVKNKADANVQSFAVD